MNQSRQFRYALEPVRLTRGWDVASLQRELERANAAVAEGEQTLATLEARAARLHDEHGRAWGASEGISAGALALVRQYGHDLAEQERAGVSALAELRLASDAVRARLLTAQRALEAIEQHRDEMASKHAQQQLNGEFKQADDQWNTLQARTERHDN